ncbi:U1 small nuclear ribonucleoprotein C-like [Camelus ferus]|uniref:U1 small nuclear ribonucleoprotein C-like n=1 Tax=Camelus ferus TaxID=419612 RepID=A0A8B8RBH2_CAMFR|nr:U1 small nuclear ribonucleoprotein C-like [Camelus ferus]
MIKERWPNSQELGGLVPARPARCRGSPSSGYEIRPPPPSGSRAWRSLPNPSLAPPAAGPTCNPRLGSSPRAILWRGSASSPRRAWAAPNFAFAPPSSQSPALDLPWPRLRARPGPVPGLTRSGPTPGPPCRRCAAAWKAPPADARNCRPESYP